MDTTNATDRTTSAGHLATILTDQNLTIYVNGAVYTVARDHRNFDKIIEAVNAKDADRIPVLVDGQEAVKRFIVTTLPDASFELRGGLVYYKGRPFTEAISKKIIRLAEAGLDPQPFLNFLCRVRENASASAQRELYLFCDANEFPITEDGMILGYKSVRGDYRDRYSGTVLNKPAALLTDEERAQLPYTTENGVTVDIVDGLTTVSMPRSEVDDRREVTCSFGLHFAAYPYARSFGAERILVLQIDPKDVVSIPNDYNNQKGRCCRYQVMAEREQRIPLPVKEVYTSEDIGAEVVSTPTRQERAAVFAQVADILGSASPSHFPHEIDWADDLEDLHLVKGHYLADVLLDMRNTFGVTLSVEPATTVNEIVEKVLAHLNGVTEALDNETLYDEAEEDEEEEEEEDLDEDALRNVLEALEDRIKHRIIVNAVGFRAALVAEDFDPDHSDVTAVVQEAGLGAWL